jgi:hypothetical protein
MHVYDHHDLIASYKLMVISKKLVQPRKKSGIYSIN